MNSSPPASPCTKICKIDPQSGYCIGCLRTLEEITQWRNRSDFEKRAVLAALTKRTLNPKNK
jgi:uncharacterized protein